MMVPKWYGKTMVKSEKGTVILSENPRASIVPSRTAHEFAHFTETCDIINTSNHDLFSCNSKITHFFTSIKLYTIILKLLHF